MGLAENIAEMVPNEAPAEGLQELRESREMDLKIVCQEQSVSANSDGWSLKVVLCDERGWHHCHRYQCWLYGSRWELWTDYEGSNPEVVMKWLVGSDLSSDKEILDAPVGRLCFGVRISRLMEKLEIATVGDLVRRTAEDLFSNKNFGMASLAEVREKLADFGLRLRGD